jgi:hypothetical protein
VYWTNPGAMFSAGSDEPSLVSTVYVKAQSPGSTTLRLVLEDGARDIQIRVE